MIICNSACNTKPQAKRWRPRLSNDYVSKVTCVTSWTTDTNNQSRSIYVRVCVRASTTTSLDIENWRKKLSASIEAYTALSTFRRFSVFLLLLYSVRVHDYNVYITLGCFYCILLYPCRSWRQIVFVSPLWLFWKMLCFPPTIQGDTPPTKSSSICKELWIVYGR